MAHTKEEIINALKIIQDTCKAQKMNFPCKHCPLSKNGGDCVLQEQAPEDWKINTSPPVLWKAFE